MMKRNPRALAGVVAALWLSLAGAALGSTTSTTSNGPYYATPSWDQQIPSTTRFITLANWGGQAVLDRETGLVWKLDLIRGPFNYPTAQDRCLTNATGGRGGWRLPTVTEVLRTVTVDGSPGIIADSPFPFLTPLPTALNIFTSTPYTLDDNQGDSGHFSTVDDVYRVLLAAPGIYLQPIGRAVESTSASAWCVQSPSSPH